jgi:hypothetical protein
VPLHELGHVEADHRVLGAKVVARERLGELRLADAGGAGEDEGRDGAVGVLEADARAADRARDRGHRLLLPDHAPVEDLLHLDEALGLVGGDFLDRDARPLADDVRDVLLGDDGAAALARLDLGLGLVLGAARDRRDLRLELHLAVAQAARLLKVLRAHGGVFLLEQRAQLAVGLARGLGERRVPEAHARAGLVDQVDRLVGEEAVGDVLGRVLGRREERLVRVAELVVRLVALAQALEDLVGLVDARLGDLDRLEAPLERGVLLDVLPVLVERRRADALELAARERGLQDVGRVDRALGRARADQRVHFVDHEDDLVVLLDLLHQLLEPLLELAAVLGARDQQAHVERDDLLAFDRLGDVAAGDALREAFGHGRLADAGLADEARVVLRAAAEDLGHALDLRLAPNARVELPLLRLLREVGPVLLERGRLVGARGAAAAGRRADGLLRLADHADDLRPDLLGVGAERLEHAARDALALAEEAEQDVLGADVVVPELARLLERELEHALGARRERDLDRDKAGAAADDLLDLDARVLERHAHRLEDLGGDACGRGRRGRGGRGAGRREVSGRVRGRAARVWEVGCMPNGGDGERGRPPRRAASTRRPRVAGRRGARGGGRCGGGAACGGGGRRAACGGGGVSGGRAARPAHPSTPR